MIDPETKSLIQVEVASQVDRKVDAKFARFTFQNADDIRVTGSGENITVGRNTGAAEPRAGGGEGADTPGKTVIIVDNGVANIYTIPATFIGPA